MEQENKPVRKRRKEARPEEITDAAILSFLTEGYEATKLEAVARQAGVAKGTLYLYFETKEQLFRSVVRKITASNFLTLRKDVEQFNGPFPEFVQLLLSRIVSSISTSQTPAMTVMIFRESRRFPDIGKIWFEEVLSPTINAVQKVIERAQEHGEVMAGDPRAYALSILGPMFTVTMLGEMAGSSEGMMPDREMLARQHLKTILHGMYVQR
ncbi:MAG TPA: TetR/AcrR family transcriptional regulator [Buttiauxella sp.]|jgi:AcrR family transcriptional regulator